MLEKYTHLFTWSFGKSDCEELVEFFNLKQYQNFLC